MSVHFHDFDRDDGTRVTVQYTWTVMDSIPGIIIDGAWRTLDIHDVILTTAEADRFTDHLIAYHADLGPEAA